MVPALAAAALAVSAERLVFFREEFRDIGRWEPLTFPKISEHTSYSIETEGEDSYLKAESSASASALVYKGTFNAYRYPGMRWRWKISNVYEKADRNTKEGDDYPIRIYILFKYDPKKASIGERIKYGGARILYGEYPPHSSLNYVWASGGRRLEVFASPYTGQSMMIPLEVGDRMAGRWVSEEVDIISDYRRAFGEDPPEEAGLGIMNDSDNTGESSRSYVDDLEVFATAAGIGNR